LLPGEVAKDWLGGGTDGLEEIEEEGVREWAAESESRREEGSLG
jgi:hypothetical protein